MYDAEIEKILNDLKIFKDVYDVIRFVDPVHKIVISYKNNDTSKIETRCFDFWGKNKICNNCISIRAYNENKTFVKVEYNAEKILMVTAIPIELGNRRIVIELLKDSTDSMFFIDNENKKFSQIHSMIDSMNNLVIKDELTGLYNRRYINEKLPIDLINAVLLKQNISIIMADIDYFKNVNDTYGHLAGDCTLKEIAKILSSCINRESDWVSRFGGEEFLICIPGATHEKTVEIAENMRKAVENATMVYEEKTFKITASFGVCSIIPNKLNKIEEIIDIADKKLYEAKNNGRNRVEG